MGHGVVGIDCRRSGALRVVVGNGHLALGGHPGHGTVAGGEAPEGGSPRRPATHGHGTESHATQGHAANGNQAHRHAAKADRTRGEHEAVGVERAIGDLSDGDPAFRRRHLAVLLAIEPDVEQRQSQKGPWAAVFVGPLPLPLAHRGFFRADADQVAGIPPAEHDAHEAPPGCLESDGPGTQKHGMCFSPAALSERRHADQCAEVQGHEHPEPPRMADRRGQEPGRVGTAGAFEADFGNKDTARQSKTGPQVSPAQAQG